MSAVCLLLLQNNDFFFPTQVQRGLKSSKDMNKTHRDKETEPPATPKSNVKKRLGWNPKQQLPNEQDLGNSAAMFWSSQALSSKKISFGNCSGELRLKSDLWVFFPECTQVHCQDLKQKQTTLCQILLPQLPQMSVQLHLKMGVAVCNQYME